MNMVKAKSYCSTCARLQNHKVLKEELTHFDDQEGWWEENSYQIIQCAGCDALSFRILHEDAALSQNSHSDDSVVEILFPRRDSESRPIKKYRRDFPLKVKDIYVETVEAFNNQFNLLCGMGVRSTLEAICLDKEIKNGKVIIKGVLKVSNKLNGKIAGLCEKGYLTASNSETLNELRILGNEVVHEVQAPSRNELAIAIDILELLIDNIYVIERKALHLRRSRELRKK